MTDQNNITQLLNQWIKGDVSIEQDLINNLYPLMRDVAHVQLLKSKNASLHTTEVVNELYINLKKKNRIEFKDKNHFLALSSQLIRRIIIDIIRSNQSIKRGQHYQHVTFSDDAVADFSKSRTCNNIDWLTLHNLLIELEKIDPDSVKLIELRFFSGLSIPEAADVLNTSTSTVSRNWKFAKSWLFSRLENSN